MHKNQKNEADEKKRKNNSIEENNMIKEKLEDEMVEIKKNEKKYQKLLIKYIQEWVTNYLFQFILF